MQLEQLTHSRNEGPFEMLKGSNSLDKGIVFTTTTLGIVRPYNVGSSGRDYSKCYLSPGKRTGHTANRSKN